MAVETAEYCFKSAFWGYHVYRQVWTPHHGQRLVSEREHGNAEDRFTIAVTEGDGLRPGDDNDINECEEVTY